MNLLLMGLRGSGKSTFGRKLALRLNRPFVDLDDLTPGQMAETTVADAFANQGEPAFRAAEIRALIGVLVQDNQVIALGGGTPTAPGFTDLVAAARTSRGVRLIYLRASAESLRSHLRHARNAHRPSLTGKDPLAEIDEILARRDPLYQSLADVIVNCDVRPRGEILDELERVSVEG